MKNQIKIRIEVVKDNHSKNLKKIKKHYAILIQSCKYLRVPSQEKRRGFDP
jgi:hypothetical protein